MKTIGIMPHTLVQIGNSKALIIPAKIIRARKYDNNTEFDIFETNDGFRIVHKQRSLDTLEFPKVSRPVVSNRVKNLLGAVKFTPEELEKDEKLAYILSR